MTFYPLLLAKAGFLLFAIGLFIGAIISKLRNPRMGLSAHLTAAQTGPALIAIALIWPYLSIPDSWTPILSISLGLSSYVLTLGIFVAAVFGASETLPIAGEGFKASKGKELTVSILVRGSSVVMAITVAIACFFMVTNFAGSTS